MTQAKIIVQPALKDNLCYVIRREGSDRAIVIDPSDAKAVSECLGRESLFLEEIVSTHHHHDHVGGNLELALQYQARISCSAFDRNRVPGATRGFADDDAFDFDGLKFVVISVPGHTSGQIALYLPQARSVFVGDTLFAMGCGRLYEGTAAQLWSSLQKLMRLPPETRLYFGHEYTERNAEFTISIVPDRRGVHERLKAARAAFNERAIVPAPTLVEECATNLFLNPLIAASALGLKGAGALECFTELRKRRDRF